MWECLHVSKRHRGIFAHIKCINCHLHEGSGASSGGAVRLGVWSEGRTGVGGWEVQADHCSLEPLKCLEVLTLT